MKDLRVEYSKADRAASNYTASVMRFYILPLITKRQGGLCAHCGEVPGAWEIDHIVYNPSVTLNELQALCIECHKAKTRRDKILWIKRPRALKRLNKLIDAEFAVG